MTSKAEKARAKKVAEKKPPTPPAPTSVAAVSAPPPPISLDDAVIEGLAGSRIVVERLAAGLPRSITLGDRQYEHVSEDEHGRWVYRA
jgi:hypothetical protein